MCLYVNKGYLGSTSNTSSLNSHLFLMNVFSPSETFGFQFHVKNTIKSTQGHTALKAFYRNSMYFYSRSYIDILCIDVFHKSEAICCCRCWCSCDIDMNLLDFWGMVLGEQEGRTY